MTETDIKVRLENVLHNRNFCSICLCTNSVMHELNEGVALKIHARAIDDRDIPTTLGHLAETLFGSQVNTFASTYIYIILK